MNGNINKKAKTGGLSINSGHIVLRVDEATVHVYSGASFPKQILTEAKQNLTGIYFYDKHQPHANTGQYHMHVYLRNNEIFAINWDGSAHDQSHHRVIPRKVFQALQAKFPGLALPADRIIESFALDPTSCGGTALKLETSELLSLRQIIYEGDHVPFSGWPFLIVGAEFRDNGDAVAEAHLIYMQGANSKYTAIQFLMKQQDFDHHFIARLDWVHARALEWARSIVFLRIDQQMLKDKIGWSYPKFAFHERSFHDLLRLWLFGVATRHIRLIYEKTTVINLKANLHLLVQLTPIAPPKNLLFEGE
jgi:hypothetical protein